jgi:hypothetical protein
MITTKVCDKCDSEQLLYLFRRNAKYHDGFHPTCKECESKYRKALKDKNPLKDTKFSARKHKHKWNPFQKHVSKE